MPLIMDFILKVVMLDSKDHHFNLLTVLELKKYQKKQLSTAIIKYLEVSQNFFIALVTILVFY